MTNCSHDDPSEHRYLVRVVDGVPASGTCPADEHYDDACKHRIAVAIRGPVLAAARQVDHVAFLHRLPYTMDAFELGFLPGFREDCGYQET